MAQKSVWDSAIIWGLIILFFVILVGSVYNIMILDNKITEEDKMLYEEIKAAEEKEKNVSTQSYVQQLKDFFFSNKEDEKTIENSQSYEEKVYLDSNRKQNSISDYTTILSNSPKLLFTIFGFNITANAVLYGFLVSLIGLYLFYLGYLETKSWLGRR